MTAKSIFSKLENDIMKVLTKNSGSYMSQYKIYNDLLKTIDTKDPDEKNNFKIKFLIVLRQLEHLFDNVSVVKKGNVLYAGFDIDKKEEKCENSDDFIDPNKEKTCEMPPEISVVNFILDENMVDYFKRKDSNDNTLLHNLILSRDIVRIKKHIGILTEMLEMQNMDGFTPIEIINDFTISNYFMKQMLNKINEMDNFIIELNKKSIKNYYDINCIKDDIYTLFIFYGIIIIFQLVILFI